MACSFRLDWLNVSFPITYDPHGLYQTTVTAPPADPINHPLTRHTSKVTAFDYHFQLPLTEEGPNGATTSYSYDSFGRLTEVYLPEGCPSDPTYQIEYHNYSAGTPYHEVGKQTITCGTTANTKVFYDGLGRKLQTLTPDDASGYIQRV